MILRQVFDFAAARYPENEAVVDGPRRYTYGAWWERVNAVASALRDLGVRRGDRVVQVIKNREENCAIHVACQKLGAVNTPINFRWTSGEIEYCVNDAEARVVVLEEATTEPVMSSRAQFRSNPRLLYVGPDAPDGTFSFAEMVEAAGPTPPDERVEESDLALMLYTSGTTGRPKGVPRSQRAEYAATIGQIVQHRYVLGERTLGVMPLYHTMGMHSLTSMLALNGLFVAMPDWNTEDALQTIQRERLTCLYLVPTLFHMLVNDPTFARHDLSSVRKLSYAGAPMLSTLVEECIERFGPDDFVNHYGSTEVYTFSIYPEPATKPGCAGRAAFHTALRVVRADPEPTVLPDDVVPRGETGEIIVSLASDEAFGGYYNRPDATAKAIRQGWYFTGDTGYLDEDCDLWVTGRVDDMIITGGENVYPVEVEDVLARHPEVADVAVVGVPDERWGQVVTAFIVPARPTLTAAEIDTYCRASRDLARFKRPRNIVLVKRIPKSPVGKILRRLLVAGDSEAIEPVGASRAEAL
jgi:2-furoate---CoA ligase